MRISDWSSDVCSSDLGSLTVDRNIDRRRAIRAKAVGRFRKRAQIDVIFLEKASIAEYDCLVVDDADDAFAHGLVDPRWLYEREPAILSRLDDRRRQRMLAAALEAGGDSEQILLLEAVGDFYCDDRRLAFGEGAGLVDDERDRKS